MTLRWAGDSHVGRVRDNNEDSFLAGPKVWAVADGLGGHAAGEVASAIVTEVMSELNELETITADAIDTAIERANELVFSYGLKHPEAHGLGSTISGVAVGEDGEWLIFNVGDSRVYGGVGERWQQITKDHTEFTRLVEAGQASMDEERGNPASHILTRAIGSPLPVDVDLWKLPPASGLQFLICSDGLSGELDNSEIAALLSKGGEPEVVVERLIGTALESGGHDNVTAVVLHS